MFHVLQITEQLRLAFDGSNYTSFTVESDGDIIINPTGGRVGINTSPGATIHALSISEQLRLSYNGSTEATFTVTSNGYMQINPSGGRIGISTSPGAAFHILSTAEQLRLSYNGSFETSFTVSSAGVLTVAPTGDNVVIAAVGAESLLTLNSDQSTGGVGRLEFVGHDSAANDTIYAQIRGQVVTNTNGSEEGALLFFMTDAGAGGSEKIRFTQDGDISVGLAGGAASAAVHVRKTTEQLRLEYDGSNSVSCTVESDGDFVINPTNDRVGINTSPGAALHILSTSEILRLSYDASTETAFTMNATGYLTMNPSGDRIGINVTPDAALHVELTTEQLRLSYDNTNSTSFTAQSDGHMQVEPSGHGFQILKRTLGKKGSDVASGTNITLGEAGNAFDITGTTNISTITVTDWTEGSIVVLQFDGVLTVNDAAGGSGQILLDTSTNFVTSAGDVLVLMLHGTDWLEISRSVL